MAGWYEADERYGYGLRRAVEYFSILGNLLTTDKGHEITVSFEGPEDLTDMTESMSEASIKVRTISEKSTKRMLNGWNAM